MPLIPTANILAAARIAAEDAVKAKWIAMNRVLDPEEQAQMRLEMKQADSEAIAAWFTANNVVTVAVSGATGTGKAI